MKQNEEITKLVEEANRKGVLSNCELPSLQSLQQLRAYSTIDNNNVRDIVKYPVALGDNSWEG
jgi:hypothetical protein